MLLSIKFIINVIEIIIIIIITITINTLAFTTLIQEALFPLSPESQYSWTTKQPQRATKRSQIRSLLPVLRGKLVRA